MSNSSITWSWPTMTRLSCCLMSLNASRSRRTDSRSCWPMFGSFVDSGFFDGSLLRVSLNRGGGSLLLPSPLGGEGRGGQERLSLIDRQGGIIQLHDGQVDGGGEDGANVAAVPVAFAILACLEELEGAVAILLPAQAI